MRQAKRVEDGFEGNKFGRRGLLGNYSNLIFFSIKANLFLNKQLKLRVLKSNNKKMKDPKNSLSSQKFKTSLLLTSLLLLVLSFSLSGCGKEETATDSLPEGEEVAVVEEGNNDQSEQDKQAEQVEESSAEEIDTSDWKTYRNEEFGFEFKYPEEWEIKNYSEEHGHLTLEIYSEEATVNEEFLGDVRIEGWKKDEAESLDDFYERVNQNYSKENLPRKEGFITDKGNEAIIEYGVPNITKEDEITIDCNENFIVFSSIQEFTGFSKIIASSLNCE